ncbi:MAG: FAD:protein FMN transferase [Phycisphaerae bacterium]
MDARKIGGRERLAALVATATLLLAGCADQSVELVETRAAMTTEITVRVVAPDERTARTCLEAAWREMEECTLRLDRWTDASDIARINANAGTFHITVDPLTISCLAAAKEVWEKTDGAFDPTVGPLLSLWREAQERNRPPTDEELADACSRVGMDKVEILAGVVQRPLGDTDPAPPGAPPPTPEDLQMTVHTVGIREGMELNLGGIAKGYIAGRMARRMQRHGATAGLVAAAGDVYAFGRRPASLAPAGGDRRWGVAVQDPRYPDDRTRHYSAVRLQDQAVDTSGHYYRGYEIQGKTYSHIIDPRTGRPVDTRLASATVVAYDPALSDGLATAMAVLGVEKGMAVVESIEGVECLLLEWAPTSPSVEGEQETKGPRPLIAHRSSGFAALEFDPSRLAGASAQEGDPPAEKARD